MARIAILYNADYGAASGLDASSVRDSAAALGAALTATGHAAELVPVAGVDDVLAALSRLRAAACDLVFNLCESLAGSSLNEPTFAGLVELYGLRYTGADLLALASCLHKQRAKDILVAHGIPTPPARFLPDTAALDDPTLEALDYPWFVKLAHEDASLGITEANVVADVHALRARARELIAEFHQPVLAERYVAGREINATVLGNGADARVLPLHEIDFGAMPADRPQIVSYAAKWDEAHVDYAGTKPVPVIAMAPKVIAEIDRVALAAYRAVGLRDYGRVDLRVDAHGTPWVIDVNPNPDISPDAGCVRAAAAAGMSYPAFVGELTRIALARSAARTPRG